MLLTICDARHEGDRHGPQSSIVHSLFSSQEQFGVLSVLANLSRHNTFWDSKCFDLKQKCPRKRVLSLPHPKKKKNQHISQQKKKVVKTFHFFKVMFSEMCIFSHANIVPVTLSECWFDRDDCSRRTAASVKRRRKRVSCYRWLECGCLRCWQTDLFHTFKWLKDRGAGANPSFNSAV